MIVVWRGLGLPILMAGFFVAGMTSLPFGIACLMNHGWSRLVACGTGAAVVYLLAWLREKEGRRDSLYFIPMKVWAIILLGGAILISIIPFAATDVAARTTDPGVPAKFYSEPVKVVTVNGLRLQGIFYSGDGSSTAIINNTSVAVGDKVGNSTVKAIEPQLVTLQAANGKVTVLRPADPGR